MNGGNVLTAWRATWSLTFPEVHITVLNGSVVVNTIPWLQIDIF